MFPASRVTWRSPTGSRTVAMWMSPSVVDELRWPQGCSEVGREGARPHNVVGPSPSCWPSKADTERRLCVQSTGELCLILFSLWSARRSIIDNFSAARATCMQLQLLRTIWIADCAHCFVTKLDSGSHSRAWSSTRWLNLRLSACHTADPISNTVAQ